VALIDAYGAANSRASSGDESRIMRMGYGADEIYTRSAQHALRRWLELSDRSGEQLFYETGVLWLAHYDDPYPLQTVETLGALAVPFEKLTMAEVMRRYPQFALEGISWAAIEPHSGVLAARRAVQAVVREAIRIGVEYSEEMIQPPAGQAKLDQVVKSNGQRVGAAAFVFACGPWLPKIFPELLGELIQPTRQEVFYFDTPGARFQPPGFPTWIDFKEEVYGLPALAGRGIKIAIDRHGPPFDPDTGDRAPTSEGLAEVRLRLARRLPALKDAPVQEARVCQYENTSRGDFLIDRHPEFENVWLVGGGSGHGFKHGPTVGEYVARRIDGSNEGIERRFSLGSKSGEYRRSVY
jgi:glycine/D-amino acid oxidase-like deaminating enzyme